MDWYRIRSLENQIREIAPVFEQRLFWIIGILLLTILICVGFYLLHRKSSPRFTLPTGGAVGKKEMSLFFVKKYKFMLILPLLIIPLYFIGWQFIFLTFFIRPNVIASSPQSGSIMSEAVPKYEIEFDLPVDIEKMQFNTSPAIEGEWKFEKIWSNSGLSRKAIFEPKESISPGQPVVIYITGMRLWLSDGKLHEHPIEFSSPTIPNIAKSYPTDGDEDFIPSDDMLIDFDSPLGDFVEFKYAITPGVQFSVEQSGPSTERLIFAEDLEQDLEYELTVFREIRTYDLVTNEDLVRSETETHKTIKFRTVTTPLLESYSPKGSGARPDSDIIAVFDQEMNMDDVEANFSVEPSLEGEIIWDDAKTFHFTPVTDLQKETEYTVTFVSGIRSDVYGTTEEDIVFSFETAGPTKVLSMTPVNGTSGHETSLTISVTFDQEVDQQSAQSRFVLSPSAPGSFSWDGNTMMYTVSGLEYFTNYTATILPGVISAYGDPSVQTYSTLFGTRSNLFTLTMPWYQQQENFTCNCAAARMVLAYYGVYLTEQQVKDGIGYSDDPNVGWVAGYGVHVGPVANFIGQYREVEIKTGWNVTELAQEVEAGHPVILWWYNRYSQPPGAFTLPSGATGYTGMHSEIARGFRGTSDNPTSILVHDPWRQYLEYNTDFFVSNWAYLNYTALVVR